MGDPIVSYLEDHLDDYLADLRALAGIDSGSYDKEGVDRVQAWLDDALRRMGFAVERNRQERFGDDVIGRREGTGRARIMVLGHADTVYPKGTAAARPLTLVGDRLMGPGTCDMKAGLLTGLYAIRALDHAGWHDYGRITYLVVSDEEIGERHSVELLKEEGPRHDAVLTLEAARENGDIVTARKAGRWFTVEAVGKAAHAGVEPEKGRSATLAIAQVIVEAFKLNGLKSGMTVNPGEITGGRAPNIVADHATAHFDLRAWTNADLAELTDALRRVGETPWVEGVTVTTTADPGSGCPAMERTPGVERLETAAVKIAGELGFSLKGARTGGGSDISFAGHRGTPGLDGLGPVGGLDHGPDEYILQSSIVPRTALLAKLLMAISQEPGTTHA